MDDEMRDRIRFIGGFVLVCLAIRWLFRHPWVIAGIVIFFTVNEMWTDHVKATVAPPHETIEAVLDLKIGYGTQHWAGIEFKQIEYPTIVRIGLRSTYEREYHADAMICSFRGPLYFAPRGSFFSSSDPERWEGGSNLPNPWLFLGERRVVVSLKPDPEQFSKWPRLHTDIRPATRGMFDQAVKVTATETVMGYVPRDPQEVITDHDTIEWCRVGENIQTLASSLNLHVDAHGVITEPHLQMLTVTPFGQRFNVNDIKAPMQFIREPLKWYQGDEGGVWLGPPGGKS